MNGADMVVEEQHGRNDNISACDVGLCAFQHLWVAIPVRCGVETNAYIVARQIVICAFHRSGQMVVERDDHDTDAGLDIIAHNVPLPHIRY